MSDRETQIIKLRKYLLAWGIKNTKHYPWRWLNDTYRVLVSEFMLHRTQVRQVVHVYEHFIQSYPTLESFAEAERSQVEGALSSLGLHWRIDGMINALLELWRFYGGVPTDENKLMAVRGIGQYIAGATVCFSRNKAVPLIDTNTVRVIGRVFGLDLTGEARRKKTVIETIEDCCDPENPRDYYYALIDFAHTICTLRDPGCAQCPLLKIPCHYGIQAVRII